MTNSPFSSRSRIENILKEHSAAIRKKWGQNFLVDPNYIRKMVTAISRAAMSEPQNPIADRDHVEVRETIEPFSVRQKAAIIEIGPGLGSLTLPLLAGGFELHAIEIDPVLCEILLQTVRDAGDTEYESDANAGRPDNRLHLYQADAIQYLTGKDRNALFRNISDNPSPVICGNLPYYISTDLLTAAMNVPFQAAYFLLQREYAVRAASQTSESSLSVYLGNFGQLKILFHVPPSAFYPAPKVESSYLQIQPYPEPRCRPDILEKLLRMSFRSRRKRLKNSLELKPVMLPLDLLYAAAEKTGLDIEKRADAIEPELYYATVGLIEKEL